MYFSCQIISLAVCDVKLTRRIGCLEFTLTIRTCQVSMEDEASHRPRRQSVHLHSQLHICRQYTATAAVVICRCLNIIVSSSTGRYASCILRG